LEVILTIFIGSKLKTSEGLGQLQKSNPWAWLISCGDEGPSDADYRKDYERYTNLAFCPRNQRERSTFDTFSSMPKRMKLLLVQKKLCFAVKSLRS